MNNMSPNSFLSSTRLAFSLYSLGYISSSQVKFIESIRIVAVLLNPILVSVKPFLIEYNYYNCIKYKGFMRVQQIKKQAKTIYFHTIAFMQDIVVFVAITRLVENLKRFVIEMYFFFLTGSITEFKCVNCSLSTHEERKKIKHFLFILRLSTDHGNPPPHPRHINTSSFLFY